MRFSVLQEYGISRLLPVTPAQAGIQKRCKNISNSYRFSSRPCSKDWIPAFAGMTREAAGMTKEAAAQQEWFRNNKPVLQPL